MFVGRQLACDTDLLTIVNLFIIYSGGTSINASTYQWQVPH